MPSVRWHGARDSNPSWLALETCLRPARSVWCRRWVWATSTQLLSRDGGWRGSRTPGPVKVSGFPGQRGAPTPAVHPWCAGRESNPQPPRFELGTSAVGLPAQDRTRRCQGPERRSPSAVVAGEGLWSLSRLALWRAHPGPAAREQGAGIRESPQAGHGETVPRRRLGRKG
jgi:hypothetical protein